MIAYVTIGNSDNKLSQAEWSNFTWSLHNLVGAVATEVYGVWFSNPNSSYQNMCACFVTNENGVRDFRSALALMARAFRQDSIALVVVESIEFVKPEILPPVEGE